MNEEQLCPNCGSELSILDGRSSVGTAIKDYWCKKCSWSAPKCGNTKCNGYMKGKPSFGGYYDWQCVKCGWKGEGLPFVKRRG